MVEFILWTDKLKIVSRIKAELRFKGLLFAMAYKKRIAYLFAFVFLSLFLYVLSLWLVSSYRILSDDPMVWEARIQKLVDNEVEGSLDAGILLFVGSSSIRFFYNLDTFFVGRVVVKKGFGGAKIGDVEYYKDDLILKHRPAVLCLYLGTNDILYRDATVPVIAEEYVDLVEGLLDGMPHVSVALIALRPIRDVSNNNKFSQLNERMKTYSLSRNNVAYLDVNEVLLEDDGLADSALLQFDGLHLNKRGYDAWGNEMKDKVLLLSRNGSVGG